MKVVFLSDLNWEPHLRSISLREVENFQPADLSLSRYERINRYYTIIKGERANLVLFAGDVTGDGSCGHGFDNAFLILLSLLEKDKISSCFISGNHDEDQFYIPIVSKIENFTFIQEISGKHVTIHGLNILGLSYEDTKSKKQLKVCQEAFTQQYDIIIAHSQLKRRIRLLEFDAGLVLTGHYDRKFFACNERVFVSLDNDSEEVSYFTLERLDNEDLLAYHVLQKDKNLLSLVQSKREILQGKAVEILKVNGIDSIHLTQIEKAPDHALSDFTADYTYLKYLRGHGYLNAIQVMNAKKRGDESSKAADLIGQKITANYSISRRLVEDYLGKV